MEQYLIDTNVISGYFSASFNANGLHFLDSVIDAVPNLSVITQIELLCWKTDLEKEQKIKSFIEDSNICELNSDVIAQCVNLRRKRKIKTPDAIIAATAISNGFILVTDNTRDFDNIKGLKIINPSAM
jgi:predicted nucleic acid-binding protein